MNGWILDKKRACVEHYINNVLELRGLPAVVQSDGYRIWLWGGLLQRVETATFTNVYP